MKSEKIRKILKQVIIYFIIFIVMLVLFCASMIATYALPNERIQGHLRESKEFILNADLNPLFGNYVEGAKLDGFTDLLILNTAMNKGTGPSESVFVRAFENSRYSEEGGNQYLSLEQTLDNQEIYNNQEYSRYWHGIQTVIRPLLLLFNYEEIRYLFMVISFVLLGIAMLYISKNLSWMHAMAFMFSMLAVCFFIVPVSVQYIRSICNYITCRNFS